MSRTEQNPLSPWSLLVFSTAVHRRFSFILTTSRVAWSASSTRIDWDGPIDSAAFKQRESNGDGTLGCMCLWITTDYTTLLHTPVHLYNDPCNPANGIGSVLHRKEIQPGKATDVSSLYRNDSIRLSSRMKPLVWSGRDGWYRHRVSILGAIRSPLRRGEATSAACRTYSLEVVNGSKLCVVSRQQI